MKGKNKLNIASSWPLIVKEQAQQQVNKTTETIQNGEKGKSLSKELIQKPSRSFSHPLLFIDEIKLEEKIKRLDNSAQQQQNNDQNSTNLLQQKQQIEKLQRKCSRLEQLESAYRKIEKDYEQMLECEELSLTTFYRLEHHLRLLDIENEQLKIQYLNSNNKKIENIPKNDKFEEKKILEEKIENLENLLLNSQEKAKLAKERATSIIYSQQQSTSNNSNIFGSILAASRLIGGEIQKVGKRKAQEFLPVGTEELFNKLNKELDNLLIGTEKSQNENNKINEENINEKTATSSKFVDLLDIRRFNVFSTDFDQWSMSGTTRDQNREMVGIFKLIREKSEILTYCF